MLKRKDPVPDHQITQRAQRQLANKGLRAPCVIDIRTQNGVVTVSGKVEYAHQRTAALAAIRSVEGARGIVDQLQVLPSIRRWG